VLETVAAVKDSSSSVLVHGETGTGKELVARALHSQCEMRKDKPFVTVNCAAIPKELMESELFGYEKGAFTGAVGRRTGRFEEAAGGVVFLDEIGELELSLQAKLLRVLQEREIERLGSNRRVKVDFRLVSSTNRDLRTEVEAGRFREDLFYRINVIEIRMPSLRERRDDIPLLATEFTNEFCKRENKSPVMTAEVLRVLQRYDWPGNVRQLRNVIERAVVLAREDKITLRDLPEDLAMLKREKAQPGPFRTLRDMEAQAVKNALQACQGNVSKAARTLGISRKAFYRRLRELQIR
jgi:DNA-binding NtrC family response regulator